MQSTKTDIYEEVVIAGFGGQGIILAGKLLAQTAMLSGMETTYMPSYGAEMRGGTANSMIIIADQPVASPLVTRPTCNSSKPTTFWRVVSRSLPSLLARNSKDF